MKRNLAIVCFIVALWVGAAWAAGYTQAECANSTLLYFRLRQAVRSAYTEAEARVFLRRAAKVKEELLFYCR
jgi:hypothetical protein